MTANNAIVDASYPYYVADQWDPGFRAESAADGLLARGENGLTRDDMTELQVDTTMTRARNAAIWLIAVEPTTDNGRLVLDRILDWDGACGSTASAVGRGRCSSTGCTETCSTTISVRWRATTSAHHPPTC